MFISKGRIRNVKEHWKLTNSKERLEETPPTTDKIETIKHNLCGSLLMQLFHVEAIS